MKIYVTEKKERTVDNDELVIIETHDSKPNKFKYLIFR